MSILCKYNELDLPELITFDDGKRIYYTYADSEVRLLLC